MSLFRITLVFLSSITVVTPIVCMSVDAKSFTRHNRTLLGDKPVESTPVAKSKSLTFVQTGGFISTHKKFERQFSDLSANDLKELEKLIAESGLAKAASGKHESGGADMFIYEFTYNDGAISHHVVYDDGTLPNSYRPLVNFLSPKMVNQPQR